VQTQYAGGLAVEYQLKEDDARLIEAVTGANAQDLVPGTDGGVTVSEAHRFCCSYLHPGVQRKD
jgi:hypothetical protein